MKIITQGKLPEEETHQGKCRNCNTIFEFQLKEGKVESSQRDGKWIRLACPFCHNNITVILK